MPDITSRVLSTRPTLWMLEDRVTPATIGNLDSTFDLDGIAFPALPAGIELLDVAPTPDGGLVAVGTNAMTNAMVAVKLTNSGQLDTSFGTAGIVTVPAPGTGVTAIAYSVAVLADGSLLLGGTASTTPANIPDFAFTRVSATGVANPIQTIDVSGTASADFAHQIAVHPSTGDLYLVGTALIAGTGFDFAVVRLNSNLMMLGPPVILDLSTGGNDLAFGIAFDSSGRVFVSGTAGASTANPDYVVVRYNPDLTGPVSQRYDLQSGAPGSQDLGGQIAINSQDQIVVTGTLISPGGLTWDVGVIQIDGNLTLQSTAKLDFGSAIETGYAIAVDAFDRVVVTAALQPGGGTTNLGIARLLPGSLNLDPVFDGDGRQTLTVNGNFLTPSPFPLFATVPLTIDNGQRIVVASLTATPSPILARFIGTIGLPTFSLIGGPPNGTGQVLTVNPPFTQFTTPGTNTNLIPGFAGVVRTFVADVNGDGFPDLISATGPGDQRIIIYDGATNAVLADFRPFEPTFTLGVYVAAGDFDNDGRADLVVTPDQGGGARVVVYHGASLSGGTSSPQRMANFFGLADFSGAADEAFRGGARPAVGDINGDGIPDLIVAAGFLGGPRITIWNGVGVAMAAGGVPTLNPIANFFAFEQSLRDGAFAAAGDVNGDGVADLIFGGGPSGGPRVRVANGAAVFAVGGSFSLDDPGQQSLTIINFFAGDPDSRGGIRVSARDIDGDGLADIITGSGDNLPPEVRLYRGTTLQANPFSPGVDQLLIPFPGILANGVFVG